MNAAESSSASRLVSRRIAPTTGPGRLSAWLALAFVGWFVLNQTIMAFTNPPAGRPAEGVLLVVFIAFGILGLSIGLAAGLVGGFAVFWRRERSPLVFLAMLPGLFVVVFVLGELLLPH